MDLRLVRITHHPFDAGHLRQFVRSALGVTAGYEDAGVRILAMNAANRSAGVAVGFGRYGACIQDDDVRIGACLHARQAPIGELRFKSCAISLRGPATEVLHEEFRHR